MNKILALALLLGVVGLNCARTDNVPEDDENSHLMSYYNTPGSEQRSATEKVASLGQPKKRVMILDFQNDTPTQYPGLTQFAGDELRRGLYLTQRVIIPTDVKSQFQTADFLQGKKINVAQLIREGKRLGVAVMVVGRISRIALRQRGDDIGLFRQMQSLAGVDVEVKMFDVNAGREIMADGRSGESSNNAMVALQSGDIHSEAYRTELAKFAIRDAMGQLIGPIVKNIEKMEWEGRIAKIIGSKVYLNSGRGSGLVAGDILKVLTKGDEVYDPENGAFLGKTQGQLKGTVEVTDFLGEDSAVGVVHTGGHFKEGDVVRLY